MKSQWQRKETVLTKLESETFDIYYAKSRQSRAGEETIDVVCQERERNGG